MIAKIADAAEIVAQQRMGRRRLAQEVFKRLDVVDLMDMPDADLLQKLTQRAGIVAIGLDDQYLGFPLDLNSRLDFSALFGGFAHADLAAFGFERLEGF